MGSCTPDIDQDASMLFASLGNVTRDLYVEPACSFRVLLRYVLTENMTSLTIVQAVELFMHTDRSTFSSSMDPVQTRQRDIGQVRCLLHSHNIRLEVLTEVIEGIRVVQVQLHKVSGGS